MRTTLLALAACAVGAPLAAQWLAQPTAGIPRTADGKPDLAAPAPRATNGHPDLSGLWRRNPKYAFNIAVDLQPGDVAPWAESLVRRRTEDLGKDHPGVLCLPAGPNYTTLEMAKIIQTPSLIAILHPDLTYRQVYMDGRALEKAPNPAWMGYSVGRWDGDALVVESSGFNDRTWLDATGHPHTEALRTTERYRRIDFGRMELLFTIDDPSAYAKPWTMKIDMSLAPDTEMIEYVCNENEKDRGHMVGKASDDRDHIVEVAPAVLAKYAGRYQAGRQVIGIGLEQGRLVLNYSGLALPLITLSETTFASRELGRLDFAMDAQGAVTHFVLQMIGSELRGERLP